MDELKNLRNYTEFKDSLNEELLFGAIKNLFSKLFAKMDKKIADSIQRFTDKIDKSPNWQTSVKAFEDSSKERMLSTQESLNKMTGPLGLRKALADTSESVFLELQILSNKYQSPNLAAKNIFKGQPEEQMFNHDNSEDFKKGLLESLNAKILQMNKDNQGGYDEAKLKEYLESKTNIDEVETAAPNQQQQQQQQNAPANQQQQQQTAPTNQQQQQTAPSSTHGADTSTHDNYSPKFINKLNEEAPPLANNPPAAQTTPANTVPQGTIANFKAPSEKWVNEGLYGISLKKIKEVKAPAAAAGGGDPVDAIAKTSKATGNPQNLAKLLRNIVNIDNPQTLAKVRDDVARAEKKDPAKFAQEIGKF